MGERWAYVDECLRVRDGLYVMAAVTVDADRHEECREALRSMLLRRQPRLHWRSERDVRREALACAVGALRVVGVVVVGTGLVPAKQRRARRKVMGRLLWALGRGGLHTILLERRNRIGDAEDRIMVDALRIRGVLRDDVHVEWGDPLVEPLLWLPDLVVGAAALAETGQDRYLKLMGAGVATERFAID